MSWIKRISRYFEDSFFPKTKWFISCTWIFSWFKNPVISLVGSNKATVKIILNSSAYFEMLSSSHRMCSIKKMFLKIFSKFTGKSLRRDLFFNQFTGLQLYESRDSDVGIFLLISRNFSEHFFLQDASAELLLNTLIINSVLLYLFQ